MGTTPRASRSFVGCNNTWMHFTKKEAFLASAAFLTRRDASDPMATTMVRIAGLLTLGYASAALDCSWASGERGEELVVSVGGYDLALMQWARVDEPSSSGAKPSGTSPAPSSGTRRRLRL